jgi:hypothetical protein
LSKSAYLSRHKEGEDEPGSAIDQKAVAVGMRKVATGRGITSNERSLLQRYEKEDDETMRWKHFRSIRRTLAADDGPPVEGGRLTGQFGDGKCATCHFICA